jgi:hypothetical protein
VAVALEVAGDDVAHKRLVVDYEDSGHVHKPAVSRRASTLRVP